MLTRKICAVCGTPFDAPAKDEISCCPECEKDKKDSFRVFLEQRRILRQFVAKKAKLAY